MPTFFPYGRVLAAMLTALLIMATASSAGAAPAKQPPAPPPPPAPEGILGLTVNNQLVAFRSDTPSTVSDPVAVGGLDPSESVLAIDFRPSDGKLYGVTSADRLVRIDTTNGVATPVGDAPFSPSLGGTGFGADFNPVTDRFRIVSDADQNIRLNADNGTIVANDATLAYAQGDANAGVDPAVAANAYGSNTAGATSTTDYVIDAGLDVLATQGSVGGAPTSPNTGQLSTIGRLGIDTSAQVGFDISARGTAFASVNVPNATTSALVTVDLTTGAATVIGSVAGPALRGIAIRLPDPVRRLAGTDRIATAVAASRNSFLDNGADAIVLSRSDQFADALAGTPLAVLKKAPLLLTPPAALDPATKAEIQRAAPAGRIVFLLGGQQALSNAIAGELVGLGYTVVRYAGATRAETAVQIARQGLGDPGTVLLATGLNFADALGGGAAAAKVTGAVLLTDGAAMAPATMAYLDSRPGVLRYALGGPAAAADPTAKPITGADRYETAQKVAEEFFPQPVTTMGIASGESFPDGLTGGAHIGRRGGPLLLVRAGDIPPGTAAYLRARASTITGGYLYGGATAITEPVRLDLQDLIT